MYTQVINAKANKQWTITFPISFSDTNYIMLGIVYGGSAQPMDCNNGTNCTQSSCEYTVANRNTDNKATINGINYLIIGF